MLRKALKISPSDLSDDQIQRLINALDKDKEGTIAPEELSIFMGNRLCVAAVALRPRACQPTTPTHVFILTPACAHTHPPRARV